MEKDEVVVKGKNGCRDFTASYRGVDTRTGLHVVFDRKTGNTFCVSEADIIGRPPAVVERECVNCGYIFHSITDSLKCGDCESNI